MHWQADYHMGNNPVISTHQNQSLQTDSWCSCCDMTSLLKLQTCECTKTSLESKLKRHESQYSVMNNSWKKHLHFIPVTSDHRRFHSITEQEWTFPRQSAVSSALTLTANYIFHHISLMGFHLTFTLFLPRQRCCWQIAMNTLFFCSGPEIRMCDVMGKRGECEQTFQTQSTSEKNLKINWGEGHARQNRCFVWNVVVPTSCALFCCLLFLFKYWNWKHLLRAQPELADFSFRP